VFDRRTFLSGAALVGGGGAGAAHAAAPIGREASAVDGEAELRDIAKELRQFRETSTSISTDVAAVREQQYVYLKSTGRYPDYIDVGIGIWERVYDWHVRWQQPITITRTPDGGYAMAFMLTTLLLKPNMQPNYVGPGADGK
jgi:hypothetical protein